MQNPELLQMDLMTLNNKNFKIWLNFVDLLDYPQTKNQDGNNCYEGQAKKKRKNITYYNDKIITGDDRGPAYFLKTD